MRRANDEATIKVGMMMMLLSRDDESRLDNSLEMVVFRSLIPKHVHLNNDAWIYTKYAVESWLYVYICRAFARLWDVYIHEHHNAQ